MGKLMLFCARFLRYIENMKKRKIGNTLVQILIPVLTIGAQLATAMKYPQYGLIINLCAQPFWIYSGWRAWHEAEQIAVFINSVIFTIITLFGIINYWFI